MNRDELLNGFHQYNQYKTALTETEKLIGENIISNRPISIFKLLKPLFYREFLIPYLELIAPKNPDTHISGLQHIELVILDPLQNFLNEHPDITFDTTKLNREINPEIGVEFDDGTEIKFHNLDIETAMRKQLETGRL